MLYKLRNHSANISYEERLQFVGLDIMHRRRSNATLVYGYKLFILQKIKHS